MHMSQLALSQLSTNCLSKADGVLTKDQLYQLSIEMWIKGIQRIDQHLTTDILSTHDLNYIQMVMDL